jgi:hypothetical protein
MEDDSKWAGLVPSYENQLSYESFEYYSHLIVYALAIVVLLLTIVKSIKIYKTDTPKQIGLMGIWLVGFIAFLISVLSICLGILKTFDIVEAMGEISPIVFVIGIKDSVKNMTFAYQIFIASIILWGILKGILNKKIRKALIQN